MNAWRSRMQVAARQHWLFVTLATAGLALRIVTQIAYRPSLLYIDSYRYLEVFRSLDPTKTQPIGYVLFVLRPVLWLGTLAAVAALQHVLGLAMGVAIYALLIRRGSPRWLGVLAAAPVLLDAYQLQIEQNIMSETLFEAFVLAGVVLLLWKRRPSYWAFAVAGVLFGFAVPVRIIGGVVIVPAIAYALVAGEGGWPRLRRAGTIALAFSLPVVAYAAAYSLTAGQVGINRGDAELLYGRAATIVEHCHSLDLPSYEFELCPKEPLGKRFGPNAYAHDLPYKQKVHVPAGKTKDSVLRDFARRVITTQPLDFANAVLRDFVKVFAWDRTTSPGDPTVDRWQFQHGYPTFPRHTNPGFTIDQYGGGGPTVVRPLASFLRSYQLSVGFTPGPFLAVAFLAGLLGAVGIGRARRSGLRAACALPTLFGLCLLLAADVFEFSWRYQLPALTLVPLGGALGVIALMGLGGTDSVPGLTPVDGGS